MSETGEGGGENRTASKGVNAFFDQCEQAILADPAESGIDSKHIFSLLARALALMTKMVKESHPKKPAIIRKLVPTVSKLLKSPILSKPSPEMSQAYSSALAVVSLQDWKSLGQESIANDSSVFSHTSSKKIGLGEVPQGMSPFSKTSDSFALKSARDTRTGTAEAAKRNPPSQGGTMMKKNRPVEIDTTASTSSKTWENSIIVKASREIVGTANTFLKSQQVASS